MVIFYTDNPIRDAADYYDWLEEHGETLSDEHEEEGEGEEDGRTQTLESRQ